MNIEVNIALDGKTITPSEDLQVSLVEIVESYIKQKIFNTQTKTTRPYIKKHKDPNAPKREARPKIDEAEVSKIMEEGRKLQYLTASKASKIVHKIMNRGFGSVYSIFRKAQTDGRLKFSDYDPHQSIK